MATVQTVHLVQITAESGFEGSSRTATYRVIYDTQPDDPGSALSADDTTTAIPALGASFPGIALMTVRSKSAQYDQHHPRMVHVVVNYSDVFDELTEDPDPLARPADITWSTVQYDVPFEVDADDTAVLNSAGDPFDPPPTEPQYRLQCTIEKNVATHDPDDAFSFINTVNNGAITIAGVPVTAGQALLTEWRATSEREGDTAYVRVAFVIQFAASFDREILDRGFYFLDGTDKRAILDDDGEPFSEPQLLDGSGAVTDTPTFLEFAGKAQTNWATLGLPTTFPDA